MCIVPELVKKSCNEDFSELFEISHSDREAIFIHNQELESNQNQTPKILSRQFCLINTCMKFPFQGPKYIRMTKRKRISLPIYNFLPPMLKSTTQRSKTHLSTYTNMHIKFCKLDYPLDKNKN